MVKSIEELNKMSVIELADYCSKNKVKIQCNDGKITAAWKAAQIHSI